MVEVKAGEFANHRICKTCQRLGVDCKGMQWYFTGCIYKK